MRLRALVVLVLLLLASCGDGADEPTTATTPGATTTSVSSTTTSTTGMSSTTASIPATTTTTTTTTPTTAPGPLAGRTVVLDPGHNGMNWAHPEEIGRQVDIGTGTKACNTTGTTTEDGYAEPTFTWEVAMRTRRLLEALGATVLLTRSDNDGWGPCITERAAVGNDAGADAVISIHADGGPVDGRGFHVIYPAVVAGLTDDIADESRDLAGDLHTAYRATGMPVADYVADDGFSERDDLGGLNLSDVPVVFLEAGNMRNHDDASLLGDPWFQDSIATAIAAALETFLGRH